MLPRRRAALGSFWALNFNGSIGDAAFTQALRWVALTNGDWMVNFEACATFKIHGGTEALIQAVAAGTDIRLDTTVAAVEHDEAGATVRAADGSLSEGQVSQGIKAWIKVKGTRKPFVALAPPTGR